MLLIGGCCDCTCCKCCALQAHNLCVLDAYICWTAVQFEVSLQWVSLDIDMSVLRGFDIWRLTKLACVTKD